MGQIEIEAAQTAKTEEDVKHILGDIHRWLYSDYATLPIAEASIPCLTNSKKVTKWDLGRTLYDNNGISRAVSGIVFPMGQRYNTV